MGKECSYVRPKNRADALNLLSQPGFRAVPLLVSPRPVAMTDLNADTVVHLSQLGLDSINQDSGGFIHIGGLVTLQDIVESPLLKSYTGELLNCSAARAATPAIRGLASLWGAINSLSGCTEFILALLALETELVLLGVEENRHQVSLGDFIQQNMSLQYWEILSEAQLMPIETAQCGWSIEHIARTPKDEPILSAVALVEVLDCKAKRVALSLSGAGPVPVNVPIANKYLVDKAFTESIVREAANEVANQCQPYDDFRGSQEYRRAMVPIIVRRALQKAWSRAVRQDPNQVA